MTQTTPKLKRIRRVHLVDQVTEQLRRFIFEQSPEVRSLPAEGKLAESFGVSRTVIREAMRTVHTQGLVELSQGKPAQIRTDGQAFLTDTLDTLIQRHHTSLAQMSEAREFLEVHIVELAAQRRTDLHLQQLQENIGQMRQAASLDKQVDLDMQFHRILAQAADNTVLLLFLEPIADLLREARKRSISRVGLAPAADDHQAILEAVKNRQTPTASKLMRHHVLAAHRAISEKPTHA